MSDQHPPPHQGTSSEPLRQSEERFRLLVEGVKDYAIFLLDPDGYVTSWNTGAERIKGYTADDIIGSHFSRFYPPEKIAIGWPQHELKVAIRDGRFEEEGWRLRKDGTRFWANVVITPLYGDDQVLRGFAKVTRDMTERKRVEALELAERRMTEFLAMLSHELRNPLAPIRNAVYLIQTIDVEDPDLQWAIDVIDRQVTQMTRLVDDLMEVGRVTSGNIRLQHESVDLVRVISAAIESSRPLMESRRHTLDLSIPSGARLLVDGDPTRLTQVVVNLLNNAAKYTPEGGTIRLIAETTESEAVIRIEDTGMGIAPELITHIFDLFTQGERTLDRSEGGLGIGLTLVRRLVELHGGKIKAFSEGAGKGSQFVMTLPLLDVGRESGMESSESTTPVPAPNGAGIHLMVVDDNVDAATSMAMLLKTWDYDVRTAFDGNVAVEIARTFLPEVVLLDIGLPGIDGYQVARHLRQIPGMENVLLIALTGYNLDADRSRTSVVGFNHHLVKPLDPLVLRQLLAAVHPGEGG